jgi:endonuclease/exonuclease/phosphatase (EEP) superfamily protein YafD
MVSLLPITAALIVRRWRLAVVLVLLALPNALSLGSAWLAPLPRTTAEADLSLVALNVLTSTRDYDRAFDYILDSRADVLVLQEVDAAWLDALSPLRERYPHRWEAPRVGVFGIAVYSRFEASEARVLPLGPRALPAIWAELNLPEGTVGLLAVHTVPPIDDRLRHEQMVQAGEVAALVRSSTHPVIVTGDLNATPWGRLFRALLDDTDLKRSNTLGLHATWPATLGPLGIPLDHALHSPGLELLAYEVGPDVGSDHRPILARYRFTGAN